MTNFEKICKGTAEELAEILDNVTSCAYCVHKDTICGVGHCKNGIATWLNKKATPELTQVEKEICIGLKHLGYECLARDRDCQLWAHDTKPTKADYEWRSDNVYIILIKPTGTFDFIQWADEEPTSIDDLLRVEG